MGAAVDIEAAIEATRRRAERLPGIANIPEPDLRGAPELCGAVRPRGGPEMELQDFFGGYESAIGMRSSFGAMLAALEGVRGSSSPDDHVIAGVQLGPKPSRNTSVWRALRILDEAGQHRELVVLHRLYGAVKGGAASEALRKEIPADLVQLVTLTPLAEQVREELACERGLERESAVRIRCVAPIAVATRSARRLTEKWEGLARSRVDLVAQMQEMDTTAPERLESRRQRIQEKLDEGTVMDEAMERLKKRLRAVEAAQLQEAARPGKVRARLARLDAEIDRCGAELDALDVGTLNETAAATSALAGADRETGHDEALEWRLKQLRKKDERTAWAAELTRECRALRDAALGAYREARART